MHIDKENHMEIISNDNKKLIINEKMKFNVKMNNNFININLLQNEE